MSTVRILLVFAAIVTALASCGAAEAASCSARAADLAARTGGRVLSIQEAGPNCRIRIALPGGDGAPRSKLFVVPK